MRDLINFDKLIETYSSIKRSYKLYKMYLANEAAFRKLYLTIWASTDGVGSYVGTEKDDKPHPFFEIGNKAIFSRYFDAYVAKNKTAIIEGILEMMKNDINEHKDEKIKSLQEEIEMLNNIVKL